MTHEPGCLPTIVPDDDCGEGFILVSDARGIVTWQPQSVLLDTAPADIAPLGTQAAGAIGKPADAGHVHPATGLVLATSLPLAIASGGTGSATQNFADLTTDQTIAGTKTFTGGVIVPEPSGASDAATKSYADAISLGLSGKFSAVAATTGSETFTISGGSVTQIDGTAVDGVSPGIGDFLLIKDAPAADGPGSAFSSQPGNGHYQVTGNTTNLSVSRAADMSGSNGPAGAYVFVEAGTVSAGDGFVVTTPAGAGAFTYGSGNIQFTQFTANPGTVTAGTGLTQTGTVISLTAPVAAASLPAATTTTQGAVILDGTAGDITSAGTQAAGAVGKAADAGHVHPATTIQPADIGAVAWTFPPYFTSAGMKPGAGNIGKLWLWMIRIPAAATITSINYSLDVAGTAVSNAFTGLYDSTGVRVAQCTTDQSANLTGTATDYAATLSSTYSAAPGLYRIGMVIGSAGTVPTFAALGQSLSQQFSNLGASSASHYMTATTAATGLTALPGSFTPSSLSAANIGLPCLVLS